MIAQPPESSITQVLSMNKTAPHYLLFTEAKDNPDAEAIGGRWRFVLEQIGTTTRIEEADFEPGVRGERLQLLAVVRGLEALEQPSLITLITPSKYVGRGIRRGLTQWSQNDWQWERFGEMALIKNHDLWKRIDCSMQIHKINCRVWQFDPPHRRTQFSESAEQLGITCSSSPFVSPMADRSEEKSGPSKIANSQKRIRRKSTRASIGETFQTVSRVSSMLADKVKPIGHGRAYGYAVN
jgi:ribonuclease HI